MKINIKIPTDFVITISKIFLDGKQSEKKKKIQKLKKVISVIKSIIYKVHKNMV